MYQTGHINIVFTTIFMNRIGTISKLARAILVVGQLALQRCDRAVAAGDGALRFLQLFSKEVLDLSALWRLDQILAANTCHQVDKMQGLAPCAAVVSRSTAVHKLRTQTQGVSVGC